MVQGYAVHQAIRPGFLFGGTMNYPAYVPRVLHELAKSKPFGVGQEHGLVHPELHFQLTFVEMAIHEMAHLVMVCPDDDFVWLIAALGDNSMTRSYKIRSSLSRRNDRPRQECMTLAAEYWILKHWGFRLVDTWLRATVLGQPVSVTVRRVMHHLEHPAKRRYVVEQAQRTMRLIRQLVKYWR